MAKIERTCLNCKNKFFRWPSQLKNNGGRFCSLSCASSKQFSKGYKGKDSWVEEKRTCKNCKEEFLITRRELSFDRPNRKAGVFCSRKCRSIFTIKSHPEIWTGKKTMGGYIYLYKPNYLGSNSDGYIAEHRFIMEEYLHKFLSKDLHVHHKNRNKLDNRLDNLIILSAKEHRKIHSEDLLDVMKKYWTPKKRKEQSERLKKLRKEVFWSTRVS